MSRATGVLLLLLDMSIRTIALSSSNRNAASALVSSVLPTPVGLRNMNEPIGMVRVLADQRAPGPGRGRNGMYRFVLADDPAHDLLLHFEKFLALAFEHLVDGHARPARDDLRHVVSGHRLIEQHAVALAFRLLELLLERGDRVVSEPASFRVVALTLRLGQRVAGGVG